MVTEPELQEIIEIVLLNEVKALIPVIAFTRAECTKADGLAVRTDVATIKYMVTRKFFQEQEPEIWEREVPPALTEHDVGVVQMKVLMGPHQTQEEKVEILKGTLRHSPA
jgi:hypothetical protein